MNKERSAHGHSAEVIIGELSPREVEDLEYELSLIPESAMRSLKNVAEGLEDGQSRTVVRLPDERVMPFDVPDTMLVTTRGVAEVVGFHGPGLSDVDPRRSPYAVLDGRPDAEGLPPAEFPADVTATLDPNGKVGYVSASRTGAEMQIAVGCFDPVTQTLYELPLALPVAEPAA